MGPNLIDGQLTMSNLAKRKESAMHELKIIQ